MRSALLSTLCLISTCAHAADISGTYDVGTLTPLERPSAFGDNLFLTEEQARAMAAREVQFMADDGKSVDPQRGVPEKGGNIGSRSTAGPPMLPSVYSNFKRIIQTDTHVMILSEMNHDARIIRLDREHRPAHSQTWLGDGNVYEYACHEGNYALGNAVRGARILENDHAADNAIIPGTTRTQRAQRAIAARGDALARWLDAFFDEPDVEAEAASTRIKLRQSATFSERDATRARTRVSAKLNLPNLSRRVSLTFQGNADEAELEDDTVEVFDDNEADSLDDPFLGLQYVFREEGNYHGSLSLGTRLDNPSVNIGPRFRYRHGLSEHWRGRYTQRILWDTEDGWESRSRVEFDRAMSSGNLFRQTLRADWRESRRDSQGYRYTTKSAYIRRLKDDAAMSYEIASQYNTQPRMSWLAHILNVRYRRNVRYDWMFFEAATFVAFEDEHHWKPNPGLRLSLEIVFDTDLD